MKVPTHKFSNCPSLNCPLKKQVFTYILIFSHSRFYSTLQILPQKSANVPYYFFFKFCSNKFFIKARE